MEIGPEKLKFWGFAKFPSSEFQNLSFDEKSRLLKNYYVEMSSKYTDSRGKPFFCCCLAIFWLCFDWILVLFWVKFWDGAFLFVGEPSNVFKKANLMSMSKASTQDDRNVNTKILAAIFWKWNCFWRDFPWRGLASVWFLRFTKVRLLNGKSEVSGEHHTASKSDLSNCQKKSLIVIFLFWDR